MKLLLFGLLLPEVGDVHVAQEPVVRGSFDVRTHVLRQCLVDQRDPRRVLGHHVVVEIRPVALRRPRSYGACSAAVDVTVDRRVVVVAVVGGAVGVVAAASSGPKIDCAPFPVPVREPQAEREVPVRLVRRRLDVVEVLTLATAARRA